MKLPFPPLPGSTALGARREPEPALSPEWLRTLAPVAWTNQAPTRAELVAGRSQLWFVLNLQFSERQDALVIEFFRNGEEGKPATGAALRPTRLTEQSLDTLDGEERALVEMLLRRPASDGFTVHPRRRSWEQFSQAVLDGELAKLLLPRLVHSGRLLWRANARALPNQKAPLQLDEARPLRLHMHMLERPSSWLLTATLVQEQPQPGSAVKASDRAWPLPSAELVVSSGFALRNGLLYRIDMVAGAQQWLEALRKQNLIEIPHRDRGTWLEFFASYTGEVPLHLPASLRLIESFGVPLPCLQLRGLESYDGRHVEAQLVFNYGDKRVFDARQPAAWIDESAGRITRRNFDAEQTLRDRLLPLGISFVRAIEGAAGIAAMELRLPLVRLLDTLSTLAAEQWRIELRNARMAFSHGSEWKVSSGVDWFELQGGLQFDSGSVALPELLKAVRRGESVIALADGSSGVIPKAWITRLETIARLGTAAADGVRFKHAQALVLDALLAEREQEQIKARTDVRFRRRLEELRDGETATPLDPPSSFVGELRPYQRDGLGWFSFLQRLRVGGCLADDMGLGKTVQVLALLESRRLLPEPRPSIVVVPKSLVFNWQQEAQRFTPQLRLLAYVGPSRHSLRDRLMSTDVVLTTYATLLRDITHIKSLRFDYAILDEAQAIKNEDSQSAKACRLLHADHRLAMSGTPVENHLGELWSLFEFLNPGLLGSVTTLRNLAQAEDSAEELQALQRALRPFFLRRTKAQVLRDLPAKSEQTLVCELSPKERRNYDALLQHYRATLLGAARADGVKPGQMHVLEALLRLRQAALHPGLLDPGARNEPSSKFEMLLEQLEELLPEGHKALVFSQFTGLLALLREQLDARGWRYAYLDGSTRDRQEAVRGFQEDPEQRLFLISLRAGGQGLNLTAADYVFILDPWWNPAVEAQAIDRAHRIGQNRAVFAYRLIAADTIEEKIVELQTRKRELADAIITAENAVPGSLTAEDLEVLLG